MKNKKKFVAAVLSLTLVFGAAGSYLMRNGLSGSVITAQASADDTATDAYIDFDASTGVMTLHGHISKELIWRYRGNTDVKSIVAAEDCVFPSDCSRLFYVDYNPGHGSGSDVIENSSMPNSYDSGYDSSSAVSSAGEFYGYASTVYNDGISSSEAGDPLSYYSGKCFVNIESIDISKGDTSKVTNMSEMFYLGDFSEEPHPNLKTINVSGIDTSKVTDMSYMFSDCSEIESLDLSSFDTSKVTEMSGMFSDCKKLTSLDVSGFKTSNVRSFASMFNDCRSLTAIDVTGFDTSNAKQMDLMFYDCENLKSVDVSGFNTSNVEEMDWMFCVCRNLTSLDVSGFDTSKVRQMSHMFDGCEKLTSIDVTNFDTSNVESMMYMFTGCQSLTELDLSSFTSPKFIFEMFSDCKSLKTIYVSDKWDSSKFDPESKHEVFNTDCEYFGVPTPPTQLAGGNGTKWSVENVYENYARIDKEGQPGYFTDIADKPAQTLGDINYDNNIDVEDAVMVINHVNGAKALNDKQSKFADVDKNGNIDIEDAVAIISHVNGVKPIS